jgi:DNA-directed RNA polymerase specialized sigma24 family protein
VPLGTVLSRVARAREHVRRSMEGGIIEGPERRRVSPLS